MMLLKSVLFFVLLIALIAWTDANPLRPPNAVPLKFGGKNEDPLHTCPVSVGISDGCDIKIGVAGATKIDHIDIGTSSGASAGSYVKIGGSNSPLTVLGTLTASAATTLNGKTTINANTAINGATTIAGTTTVNGATTFTLVNNEQFSLTANNLITIDSNTEVALQGRTTITTSNLEDIVLTSADQLYIISRDNIIKGPTTIQADNTDVIQINANYKIDLRATTGRISLTTTQDNINLSGGDQIRLFATNGVQVLSPTPTTLEGNLDVSGTSALKGAVQLGGSASTITAGGFGYQFPQSLPAAASRPGTFLTISAAGSPNSLVWARIAKDVCTVNSNVCMLATPSLDCSASTCGCSYFNSTALSCSCADGTSVDVVCVRTA